MSRLTPTRTTLLAAAAAFFASGAWAFDFCPSTGAPQSEANFGPYEDSFAIGNQMNNHGWAGRDEAALRAHYSFKYTLCGEHHVKLTQRVKSASPPTDSGWEVFLSYTGEFDFYMGTRPSGPVVNRLNNPAINLRLPLQQWYHAADIEDNLVISLEHRSNGQTTEVGGERGTEKAQRAWLDKDRAYFDTLSRGSNYIGLALQSINLRGVSKDLDVGVKLRLYLTQDSEVRWGPWQGKPRSIKDYDLLETTLSHPIAGGWADAAWRVGMGGIKISSLTLGFQRQVWIFPLYFRYHYGPMNTLANYTQRQDSFGIGLRFARPTL